jgi:hypothetical protein
MRPGSEFLARLANADLTIRARTTSIRSAHDNMVIPQASCRLEGAQDVVLPGLGHIAMLRSASLVAGLVEALEAARGA